MLDLDDILGLIRAMNDEGVQYITFEALAMWVHGIPRLTEDADFFIAPNLENINRLKSALKKVWNDEHLDEISAEELLAVTPAQLYQMKRHTVRPKDWGDAEALRRKFSIPEE
jgi:hypothetical protein